MNIIIKRIRKRDEAIDGALYIDGLKICDCAENAKSAIPVGTYPIIRHKCKQKARYVPLILQNDEGLGMKVEGKSLNSQLSILNQKCSRCKKLNMVSSNTNMPCFCPQIAMGNGVHNRTDGAIIVGKYLIPGCLTHTKEPYENICERLRKLDSRGSSVTITIVEDYPKQINHFTI